MHFLNAETISFWKICFRKAGDLSIQKLHSKSIYLSKLLNFLREDMKSSGKPPIFS